MHRYIDGFVDGLNSTHNVVCLNGATVMTMARVYVAYMQKNPKLMDEYKSVGLLRALKDGYPCTK